MDQRRGDRLIRDRYEPLDVLGRGGQGEVWKALDHQHGRVVALKVRPVSDGEHRDRILAEARILLSLQPHPSLPLVREDFFWDDGYVLVMDWVEGTDLGVLLLETGDPGLPVSSVLAWLSQAAAGVDHLHGQGIVHGDVKPANLVLTPEGRVVLVDFGISRRRDDHGLMSIGSPGYAAPEASAGDLSGAADVYGLAATAVALLTGAPPTGGRPEWEGVPNAAAIERAIRRGLATDPTRRPRSANELVERLQAHLFLDLPTGVVTFLLTDIEGSTARWEDDPDSMADLIAVHDGLIADAVESGAGRLLKTRGEGDSTFSVFTRASDAASAAVVAQRSLRSATGLSVRMAIHTGEAETRDGDYFGRTVNRASRLRSIAHGGQILLSSAAADLVVDSLPDACALVDLGFRELRDLARGEQVFALTHPDLDPVDASAAIALTPTPPTPAPARPATDATMTVVTSVDTSTSQIAASDVIAPRTFDPSVEIARLAPSATTRGPFPAALASVRSPSFVGRVPELDRLREAWRAAHAGDRRLILLAGEPGIGKTQLAIEIAAEAYQEGAIVLHGRCDDGLQVPFQPFATALRQAIDDAETSNRPPTLGRLAGELVRLVPDVTPWPVDVSPPIHADPETEQYRLFDAVSQWLQALAAEVPVVVVLDDLHWATRPTLHLLRHVFRSTESARLLLVGTYRDTEVGRGHPLTELLADLHRVPGLERHTLDGLREYDIVDLLDAFAGHSLGPSGEQLAHSVHVLTDGNPFFVRELRLHLVEIGALTPVEEGRWTVNAPAELGVPESVREVVGRRLARLSEAASATLELAAVIGPDFDLDVVVAAGRLDEDAVLTALDEAVAARLVLESGPLRFRFAHNIVRATIIEGLTRARLSRAHRRVADAIELRHADNLDAHLTELAMHYAASATAGEGTKAVEYAMRAGDLALQRLAYDEGVECYSLARRLLGTTEAPVDEQTRGRLLLALGNAQRLAGFKDAIDTLSEAARLARRWRDPELLADVALANARSSFDLSQRPDDERIATLEAALEMLDENDSGLRSRLLAHLAVELSFGGDAERRISATDQALAIARRLDDPTVLAEVMVLRSFALVDPELQAERLPLSDQQLALAHELGDPALEVMATINGVVAAVENNDRELAFARLERAKELADELGQPGIRWQVKVQEARLLTLSGDFDAAEAALAESLELGQSAGQQEVVFVWAAQLYALRFFQGRLDETAPLVRQASGAIASQPLSFAALAEALIAEGDLDGARDKYESVLTPDTSVADVFPRNGAWLTSIVMLAQVTLALGDRERASEFIDVLTPFRDITVADRTTYGGPVALYLGRLLLLAGRIADAEAALRDAVNDLKRMGARPLTALAELDLAAVLLMRDRDSARAETHAMLIEAQELCAALGIELAKGWPGWPRTAPALTGPPSRPPTRQTPESEPSGPLVGRTNEMERLLAAWGEVAGGATRIVLVSGEPGAGKTRLFDEVAAKARDAGAIVLRGHSDDGTGGSYQPFVEALRDLTATAGADLPRMLGRLGNELTRLVPELTTRLPGAPQPLRADPDTERYRLFDAVAGWLRATSTIAPLVLILDDLHDAGRPTLQMLRHVAGSITGHPVLVLGAYRDTDIGRTHALAELLADLHRVPTVERLAIGGLSEDDVVELVEDETGQPVDSRTRALALAVHKETNGNALFVRELLRHFVREGGDATTVPDSVRTLAERRLARFSPTVRDVLSIASVMGDDIDMAVLTDVADLDDDSLLSALDVATDAGILREELGARARYSFVHSVVRATLYEQLEPDARARLHQRVGESWERRHGERTDDHLPMLTHHFMQGGADQARAAEYSMRAGDRAMSQLAHEEAIELYERALELAAPDDDRRRAEILVKLGLGQRIVANPRYRTTLLAAAEHARRAGANDLLIEAAITNFRSTFSALGDVDLERVALLEEALGLVGEDDSAERAKLLGHLAIELTFNSDFERRDQLSAEALSIARRLDDPTTLAQVLSLRCDAIGHAKTFDERRRLVAEQQEIAARIGDPNLAVLAAFDRHTMLLAERNVAEADRVLDRALEAMAATQQSMLQWVSVAARANRAFIAGRYEETEQLLNEGLLMGQAAAQPDAMVIFAGQIGLVRFFQGRLNELEALLAAATDSAPALTTFKAGVSVLYAELGRIDEARAILDELGADGFASLPEDLVWLTGVAFCAHTCGRLGDASKAPRLFEMLLPYRDRFVIEGPSFLGAVSRYLGVLSTVMRRWDEADALFADALEAHNAIGAAGFAVLTRLDWARMLLARGVPEHRGRAHTLLEEAVAEGERLGTVKIVDEARQLLETVSRPPLPTTMSAPRSPFVGRDEELTTLRQLWHKAQSGTRQLALIAGEPGIGKTRLAEELAAIAHGDGGLVLFGRCDDDAVVPLQPFVEILRMLSAGNTIDATHLGPALRRLLPEYDGQDDADGGDPVSERARLLDALGSVLDTLAERQPIVIVLDDLQWADQPSLLAIRHLMRRPSQVGMLVVGTYRDSDVSRTHPLADVLAELRRERLFERIALRGLTNDEVVSFVERLAGYDLDEEDQEFALALRAAAEGNPFFIEEILRHLIETGQLARHDGRWDITVPSWDELGVPEGVREVVGRRLSRLSSTGEQVLAACAVLGRTFAFDVVKRMVRLDEDAAVEAIEEALALHLLIENPATEPSYTFSHGLVRETLYDELSLPRRQRLHLVAAQAIEASYPLERLTDHVGALAVHQRQAGAAADPTAAVSWSVRAGEAAFRVFAYEEAASHFEGAIAVLADYGGRDNDLERARLLERLGQLRIFTGSDEDEGVRHAEAALAIYERFGDWRRAAIIHSQIGSHLSTVGSARGLDVSGGLRHLQQAAEVLGGGRDRAAGYVHMGLANAGLRSLRLDETAQAAETAGAIAEELDDAVLAANALLLRGLAEFERGDVVDGGRMVEDAHAGAEASGSPFLVLLTCWNRGYMHLALDDPVAADAWYTREMTSSRFEDAPRASSALEVNHNRCLFELGRLNELEPHWREGWSPAIADRLGTDPSVARTEMFELLGQLRSGGDRWTLLWHLHLTASALRMLGLAGDARAVLDEAAAIAFEAGTQVQQVVVHCEYALLDPASGREHVDAACQIVGGGDGFGHLAGRVSLAEGVVLAAENRPDDADAAFAAAVESMQQGGRVWHLADAFAQWGRHAEAAEVYRSIDAAPHWVERLHT